MASPAKKEKKAKAPKPAKAAKPKGDKKAKTPANHPKYTEMITKSIADLKERGGSSRQAILKYIMANFQIGNDAKVMNMHFKQALKRCLANGIVINPKGTGVTGSSSLQSLSRLINPWLQDQPSPQLRKPQSRKQPNLLQLKSQLQPKRLTSLWLVARNL
jgi:histone H1/5